METIWKVRYETEILTTNSFIKPKGFSSITFRNLGDTDCTVLNDVPVKAHVTGSNYYDEYLLLNRPGEIIEQDISITFSTLVTITQLLVVKTFYEK